MKTLSELLVQEKIISREKMILALREQDTKGGILGLILLSKGYITEEQLIRYIARPETSLF